MGDNAYISTFSTHTKHIFSARILSSRIQLAWIYL